MTLFSKTIMVNIGGKYCHKGGDHGSFCCGQTMTKNQAISIFTLKNSNNLTAQITNYGGIVISLSVPDRTGQFADVVLGYPDVNDYKSDTYFFGALIGRYANRIAEGRFELNGVQYQLATNDGPNHLHGGTRGFDQVVWQPVESSQNQLKLEYISGDQEENYPGRLYVQVTYTLTDDNELRIDYWAVADQDTIVNLTNHSYFNLKGHDQGDILDHQLQLNADYFTPINSDTIPTGEIVSVANTPMDFRKLTQIRANLDQENEQIKNGLGFDHNWVLRDNARLKKAAELYEPTTGRLMEVYTTKPGIQFYSGNFLKGPIQGKAGAVYDQHSGLCLETQYFPNSPNCSHFSCPVLRAGEIYNHTTIYSFKIKTE